MERYNKSSIILILILLILRLNIVKTIFSWFDVKIQHNLIQNPSKHFVDIDIHNLKLIWDIKVTTRVKLILKKKNKVKKFSFHDFKTY